jgi:tetratricopeptide (TPR) repeat protein
LERISIERGASERLEYQAAEEFYCQMLKRFERNHNPTQPNTLRGLHNLGVVLMMYRRLEEAEKAFLRILEEIGGSLRPEDDMTLVRALNNLAEVKQLQGKSREAEMLLRRALNGREERSLDDLHSDSLLYLCNNLAVNLHIQNQAKTARDLQERVVEIARHWYDIEDSVFKTLQRNLEGFQR